MGLTSGDAAHTPAEAETLDPAEHVGWFRHYFATDTWEWSAEVYLMHALAPGTVVDTAIVLSHIHSHDRHRCVAALQQMRTDLGPLSLRHRIVDRNRDDHSVVMVADVMRDVDGAILGMQGFYVDVTGPERLAQKRITEQLGQVAARRAIIEQAKGMLMVIYGFDSEMAFEILSWRSQMVNVKVHVLAQQLVEKFASAGPDTDMSLRDRFDAALTSCTTRMTN